MMSERPLPSNPIDSNLHCGAVSLIVGNLDRSLHYYEHDIGLQVQHRASATAALGAGGLTLLHLIEQRGVQPVQRGHTGLYHFALLLPDRVALSRALNHLLAAETPIDGASNHGVSEALYLSDPDGHGIELYCDRPRREWPFVKGSLGMTTNPLDVRGLMAADRKRTAWEGIDPRTIMGHVHLHVADLAAAEHFYVDLLGLDLMQRFGGQVAFVSAGGYHHHVGLNTWAGIGAPPPSTTAARLLSYELVAPAGDALHATVARLRQASIAVAQSDHGWAMADPSANRVVLRGVASEP